MPHDLERLMTRAAVSQAVASQAYVRLSLTRHGVAAGPIAGMRHRKLMAVQAERLRMANRAVTPQYRQTAMGLQETLLLMRRRLSPLMALIAELLSMAPGAVPLTELLTMNADPVPRMRHRQGMAVLAE